MYLKEEDLIMVSLTDDMKFSVQFTNFSVSVPSRPLVGDQRVRGSRKPSGDPKHACDFKCVSSCISRLGVTNPVDTSDWLPETWTCS